MALTLKPETIDRIEKTIPRYPNPRSALMMVLHYVQADPEWCGGISEVEFAPNGDFAVLRAGMGPPRTNDLWLLPLDSAGRAAPRIVIEA